MAGPAAAPPTTARHPRTATQLLSQPTCQGKLDLDQLFHTAPALTSRAVSDPPLPAGRTHLSTAVALAAPAAAALAAVLLFAPHAHASEGEMAPGVLEFIIETIENLGPWGPAAFVTTVAVAESIPLFPTQVRACKRVP